MNAPVSTRLSSRRDFLKTAALGAGGLVVAFFVPGANRLAGATEAPALFAPNAFLRITADDRITVLLAHSEMGQGIWTALPMLIAEELDADWNRITVEHAPAAPDYFAVGMPMQFTGGSSSTWTEFERYRRAGATARALLVQAAATKFGVKASACRTENGEVIAGDKRARYGELVVDAAKLKAPKEVPLKDAKDWKLIGKPTRRLDTAEKIDGRAKFGMDVQFDGLLTAVVARSPVFGGTVTSFDATAARQVPGVRDVVQVPSGVAVIADHFWAAKRGRDALKVDWNLGANASLNTDTIRQDYAKQAGGEGLPAAKAGDAAAGLAKAATRIEAEFAVPYLAHAAMEPLNCSVKITADACEIWTGTQFQTLDQAVAARITGLKPEQVTIHTMFLGGGFGRRATPTSDFVAEAVEVAKAAGKPVKTVWTREDDMRGGYYRPAFVHRATVGLDAAGKPVAWQHRIVGQSILGNSPFKMMIKNGIDATSVEGVADSPYIKDIADHRVDLHSPELGVPVLWLRSVGHTHTAFVMESLVDELAKAAGKDPLAYRQELLQKHKRHLGALNLAAEKAGWGSALPQGRARGLAVHESFGSFAAQVAEISIVDGAIRVHRVVCAIDCGIAVNPAGIVAQMESGIVFGLSAALHGRLDLKDGRVQQSNFHDYRVLRMNEMPQIEVHVVPSTDKPGGVGEVGVPPVAAAVANALFALTGERQRELPLRAKA
ncbi:MAG TPA: xanthine dehydrogenase family protein molybdopterin-binding subunit [Tahibacter sp.]|uniref:xanthine dehydrogenase family protein molybdopterin-binding subunit n=1 Tax=Tahibacter sp. TaxID=2056211 RepID=UPI002B92DEFF|nr:xanthine dehydrogenase family protein molybdopterin-binding subunit [Tahibacter sp.]HSX62688.1 xanthine dehydrogenase family protein molybdopterin-binding subunit [Tahibacter sp.]